MNEPFGLLLFSTDTELIVSAVEAGVDGILVDWEHIGKESRQSGADTQINHDTLADLERVRRATAAKVLCRINRYDPGREHEIEEAIGAGADEILLPMVRTVHEVETVLDRIGGRCGLGILIETADAVRLAGELARLPLSRVYMGFNDLAIDRGSPCLFSPLAEGLVDRVRAPFRVPFGFGGLTLPEFGEPIPCRLLMAEMARLGCGFSFLRRSFLRDLSRVPAAEAVPRIRQALRTLGLRSEEEIRRDRENLVRVVRAMECRPDAAAGSRPA